MMSLVPGPIHNDYNSSWLSVFNYTAYSNGTVSNGTSCWLSFGVYQPILFDNGTFVNTTVCDSPVYPIGARGGIGIAWAVLLLMLLPASLFNLHKHGTRYLQEKKSRPSSRRWPWYWLIILQVLGAVAGFFSIDLDRDYIQGTSLECYGAIFSAAMCVALAAAWEFTRQWGAFENWKLDDEDPYRFQKKKIRSLAMCVVFYVLVVVSFFLVVLRNWNSLVGVDARFSVDGRWKVGVFVALVAWFQICAQVLVTKYYYQLLRVPLVIPVLLVIVLALVGFQLTYVFDYGLSPFNVDSSIPFVVLLGYFPILVQVLLTNLNGLVRENDDRVILALRRSRDGSLVSRRLMDDEYGEEGSAGEHRKSPSIQMAASPQSTVVASFEPSFLGETPRPPDLVRSNLPHLAIVSSDDTIVCNDRDISKVSKFFGSVPIKGANWLSHNLNYLPGRHQQIRNDGSTNARNHTLTRPPPVDLREKWRKEGKLLSHTST
jgi:hypothetical protein